MKFFTVWLSSFLFCRNKTFRSQLSGWPENIHARLRRQHNVIVRYTWRRNGKKKKLSCVKLAICPDHPRRRSPL